MQSMARQVASSPHHAIAEHFSSLIQSANSSPRAALQKIKTKETTETQCAHSNHAFGAELDPANLLSSSYQSRYAVAVFLARKRQEKTPSPNCVFVC